MSENVDEIQQYYSDIENCKRDLLTARRTFGDRKTTREQYDQLEKALGLMYLYCPEEIETFVSATLQEANVRRTYFEIVVWD